MERIEGMISDIVFKNEDNGYTIAHLANSDNEIVIVGCMPTLSVGESIEVEGKWVNHKTYGTQFEVEKFMPITPSSLEGIYVYLSSGMIHGIGEKMAKRIVDKFGVDTLNVIQNAPERLKEVEGIGSKKIDQIVKSYEENRELRNIIIELSPYGITPNYCMRIYKKYKNKAIKIINENPYKLAEDIRGIGFKIADNIANKIGIEKDSKDRVSQGILYTLNQSLGNGHTYLPKHILLQEASKLLEVKSTIIEECIISLAYDQKVHIENVNGEQLIYLIPYYLSENGVCKQIIKLSQFEFENLNIDIDEEIKYVEEENSIKLAKNQSLAVKEAIENGVVIITGGPGTGKTTTINTIIKIFENNKKEVILAAPTGRAAKRISETSGREAKTIHRLLEMGYATDSEELQFMKNEEDPITADVIIIDEVSMVDVLLMYSLLRAIKPGTRLILVGDSDQLPSVGAGNVLKDMIDSNVINVVRLNEIFRQARESMIVVNAHKINKGEPLFLNSKGKDFFFLRKGTNEEVIEEIVGLVSERLPKFYKLDKLKDIQILSSMRKGDLGVINLNNELQKYLNPPHKFKVEESFQKRIFRVVHFVLLLAAGHQGDMVQRVHGFLPGQPQPAGADGQVHTIAQRGARRGIAGGKGRNVKVILFRHCGQLHFWQIFWGGHGVLGNFSAAGQPRPAILPGDFLQRCFAPQQAAAGRVRAGAQVCHVPFTVLRFHKGTVAAFLDGGQIVLIRSQQRVVRHCLIGAEHVV